MENSTHRHLFKLHSLTDCANNAWIKNSSNPSKRTRSPFPTISLIVTAFSKQRFDLKRYTNPYESGPTFLQTSMIFTALKLVTRPLSHKLAALSHKISVSSSCNSAPYTNYNEFEPPKFLSLKVCCKNFTFSIVRDCYSSWPLSRLLLQNFHAYFFESAKVYIYTFKRVQFLK